MGLGVVALGLWLIFGIQFNYNNISLFPDLVAYTFLWIGICLIMRKKQSRYFILASILLAIDIIYMIITTSYTSFIMLIALYCLFVGIDQIAINYEKRKQYQKYYKIFLLLLLLMEVIAFICNYYMSELLLMIASCILILLCIFITIIDYHLLKINRLLEEDYMNLEIQTVSKNGIQKLIIMILLSCMSISCIVVMKEEYVFQISREVINETAQYFKVDEEDYKIAPFGFIEHQSTTLGSQEVITEVLAVRLFLKDELLKPLSKVKYTFLLDNQIVLQSYDKFKIIDYNDYSIYYGHNPFPGYTGGILNEDIYEDLDTFRAYDYYSNDVSSCVFEIELYDKEGNCYYKDRTNFKLVTPTTYRYEDENIRIENFQYDMNSLVSIPSVKIKVDDPNIQWVAIYYPDAYEDKDPLILEYRRNEDGEFESDLYRNLIYSPIQDIKTIRIDYCGENFQEDVIFSTFCEMEVAP